MVGSYRTYGFWEQYRGRRVNVDGMACKLRVSVFNTVYPVPDVSITVDAVALSRNSAEYRRIKSELGDDWSTDILASPELAADILRQLSAE